MGKNKGFTLIEMIVTIGLLALIGITVGISLNKIFKNNEIKSYDQYVDKVKDATILYVNNHAEIINDLNDKYSFKLIVIQNVIDEGYLSKKLKNPLTNKAIDGKEKVKVWISEDKELVAEYPYDSKETENYLYAQTLKIKYKETDVNLCYAGLNTPTLQLIDPSGNQANTLTQDTSIKAYFEDGSVCNNLTAEKVGSYKIKYVYTIDGSTISDTNENVREATRTITVNPTKPQINTFEISEGTDVYNPKVTYNISDESSTNPGLKYCISTSSNVSSCTSWIDVKKAGYDEIAYPTIPEFDKKTGTSIYLHAKNIFEEYTSKEIKEYGKVTTVTLTIDIGEYRSSDDVKFNNNETIITDSNGNKHKVEVIENYDENNTSSNRQNNKYVIYDVEVGTKLVDILSADDFTFTYHYFAGLYESNGSPNNLYTKDNFGDYVINTDTTLVAKWNFLIMVYTSGGTFTYNGEEHKEEYFLIEDVPKGTLLTDYLTKDSFKVPEGATGCKLKRLKIGGEWIEDITGYTVPNNIKVIPEYTCDLTIDIGDYADKKNLFYKDYQSAGLTLQENYVEGATGNNKKNNRYLKEVVWGSSIKEIIKKENFKWGTWNEDNKFTETHTYAWLYEFKNNDKEHAEIDFNNYKITKNTLLKVEWYYHVKITPILKNTSTKVENAAKITTKDGKTYTKEFTITTARKGHPLSEYISTIISNNPEYWKYEGIIIKQAEETLDYNVIHNVTVNLNMYKYCSTTSIKAETTGSCLNGDASTVTTTYDGTYKDHVCSEETNKDSCNIITGNADKWLNPWSGSCDYALDELQPVPGGWDNCTCGEKHDVAYHRMCERHYTYEREDGSLEKVTCYVEATSDETNKGTFLSKHYNGFGSSVYKVSASQKCPSGIK